MWVYVFKVHNNITWITNDNNSKLRRTMQSSLAALVCPQHFTYHLIFTIKGRNKRLMDMLISKDMKAVKTEDGKDLVTISWSAQ